MSQQGLGSLGFLGGKRSDCSLLKHGLI